MGDTLRLGLPLLDAGQAQKHVTINEALVRVDGFTAAPAASRSLSAPPAEAGEGALYVVGPSPSGAWAGRDGWLALMTNGGWSFARPEIGRRLWVVDESGEALWDGASWIRATGGASDGAATRLDVVTVDYAPVGAASVTPAIIPDKSVVIGVTARVLTSLTGPGLTAWRLGAPGAPGRYGSGYGLAAGSWAEGVTGQPLAYFAQTPLVIEAEAGTFEGGSVRLAVHCLRLTPPRAV